MSRRDKAGRMGEIRHGGQRGAFGFATDHPGSKPGARQRERVAVVYPETAEGVPPQHKMRRPGLAAVPMRNDVRRAHYQRQGALIEGPDGVTRPADKTELAWQVPGITYPNQARLTPAQRRRLVAKLSKQTIGKPSRQVTRTDLSVSAIEAGGYTMVPEIGSITWSEKVRRALRPKSKRQAAREAAEASRAARTRPAATPRPRRDQGRRSS